MFSRVPTFLLYAAVAVIFLFLVCDLRQNKFPTISTQSPASKRIFDDFSSFRLSTVLFPPSALISLTADNATFFVARPAAFGPLLPATGLSGQLWVASEFGEHTSGLDEKPDGNHGELGCGDIPGWTGLMSNIKESRTIYDELRRNNDGGLRSEEEYDAEVKQASQVFVRNFYV